MIKNRYNSTNQHSHSPNTRYNIYHTKNRSKTKAQRKYKTTQSKYKYLKLIHSAEKKI